MSATPDNQPTGDDYFDINKFEQLLQRLEGSKGRQQRQKSLESRRDIYAQGLASMMSNFWLGTKNVCYSHWSIYNWRLFWYQ